MSTPSKRYKSWKFNSSESIPTSFMQRWQRRYPEDNIFTEHQPTEDQTIPEHQSTEGNTVEEEKPTCSRKYKSWVADSLFSIPESTLRRFNSFSGTNDVYQNQTYENENEEAGSGLSDVNETEDYVSDSSNAEYNENEETVSYVSGSSYIEQQQVGDYDSDSYNGQELENYLNNSSDLEYNHGSINEEEQETRDYVSVLSDGEEAEVDIIEGQNKRTEVSYLYENCKMSVNEAVVKIMDLWMDQKLSKVYLKQHLELMHGMLPEGNLLPKTPYKFFQYVKSQVPLIPIIKHLFCENCLVYLSTNAQTCFECGGTEILFFFELDLKQQIKQLFELKHLSAKLKSISDSDEFIKDITSGTEYKRVNSRNDRQKFDLTLMLYTDGLSLVNSSTSHCWPLMFAIAELPPNIRYKNIVTFGLWCSSKIKPSMNLFLQPFCTKIRECFEDGVDWIDPTSGFKHKSKITAPLFIADAPARALIQNILNFNGKFGCNVCEIQTKRCVRAEGKKIIRVYAYESMLPLRNNTSMALQAESCDEQVMKGVKGYTIVSLIPKIDISTCVLPEFMHSVLLGVVKQFINIWLKKNGPWKIKKYINKIDEVLLSIKPPQTFGRLPRSLENFLSFKATEFYNFLLYYSLPALSKYLPKPYFDHWMLLVTSIYKMLKEEINVISDLKVAEQLLKAFVSKIEDLYGEEEFTYNVHQLLHLTLSVQRWGPLWATSAFMFEDKNGLLARNVHGNNNLGQELINNLQIIEAAITLKHLLNNKSEVIVKKPFVLLGKNIDYIFNNDEISFLSSENIDIGQITIFSRAEIHNVLYTSTLYKKIKTNSFTVMINADGSTYYGSIRLFFIVNGDCFILLQQFFINESKYFINNSTESKVDHILPVEESNNYLMFKIENINCIKQVIRVENFICLKPNSYDLVI